MIAGKWLTVAEVPAGSGTGRQLHAMREFASAGIGADAFVDRWLDARRDAIDAHDPCGARIEEALDDLFYSVDDYDPGSTDREPEWIDADQLRDAVVRTLTTLDAIRSR